MNGFPTLAARGARRSENFVSQALLTRVWPGGASLEGQIHVNKPTPILPKHPLPETAAVAPDSLSPSRPRIPHLRYSAIELLCALVLLLLFLPFLEEMPHGATVETLLLTLVFVSSVYAVGSNRSAFIIAGALTVLSLSVRVMEHLAGPAFPPWIFPPLAMITLGFVIVNLVRSTLEARQVDARVLSAGIAAYLIIGLLWSLAYLLVGRLTPEAFAFPASDGTHHAITRFDAFYFSFVTLSTVGYGDISPVSKVARMLAVTEAMTGMLYVAVLIARLVSLYSAPQPPTRDSP